MSKVLNYLIWYIKMAWFGIMENNATPVEFHRLCRLKQWEIMPECCIILFHIIKKWVRFYVENLKPYDNPCCGLSTWQLN